MCYISLPCTISLQLALDLTPRSRLQMRGINVFVCQTARYPRTLYSTNITFYYFPFIHVVGCWSITHTHTPHPAVSARLAWLPDVSIHFPKEDQLVRMMQFGAFDKYFYVTWTNSRHKWYLFSMFYVVAPYYDIYNYFPSLLTSTLYVITQVWFLSLCTRSVVLGLSSLSTYSIQLPH